MSRVEKLGIFLDSRTISELLSNSDDAARRLVLHHGEPMFEFFRSERSPVDVRLEPIAQAEKRTNQAGNFDRFDVTTETGQAQYHFGYRDADVETIGKLIFGKDLLSPNEKECVQLIFIQATLNGRGGNLFVTADEVLLKKRLWFESHFPGGRVNIANVEEAVEIMGLVAKKTGKYYISNSHTANKGLWYWYSFRSKIPHYNFPMPSASTSSSSSDRHIMEAFAARFVFMLVSLDEMGIQYYSGVNNDTMDNTMYHFNYFISLVSGIFDSLAIEAKNRMGLAFEGDHVPSRTSLSNKSGKEFLRALRDTNQNLRNHITANVDLINITYLLRESILHGEGFRDSAFELNSADAKWKANFLRISTEASEMIRRCGNRPRKYDPWSEFGVYEDISGHWLSPFIFAKAAVPKLVEFSDKFLEMMGYDNFILALDLTDEFRQSVNVFERDRLGL
jgi:hypothetical protein